MRYERYDRRYKYRNQDWVTVDLPLTGHEAEIASLVMLSESGAFSVLPGYAWDGPSGLAIDTENFMRGSLVHDALYQMMREGLLSCEHRRMADETLRRLCREDGMSAVRASWVYHSVRLFGARHAGC